MCPAKATKEAKDWTSEQLRIPLGFHFAKAPGARVEFPPSPERARWWFARMHAEVERVVSREGAKEAKG